jgi:acyl-CoA thioesterase-1
VPQPASAPAPKDNRPVIVAFGDSLSAGFGVETGESYPDFLQKAVDEAGFRYRVVNAGISGDTTSSGLARVDSIAAMKPAVVILELGGNDGLRGLPLESTRANLEQIIAALKKAGAAVVLAGMTLPPNYGPEYIGQFEGLYKELASKHGLALAPFFDTIAGRKGVMQRDGIHLTVEGNRIAAANVYKAVAPLLKR